MVHVVPGFVFSLQKKWRRLASWSSTWNLIAIHFKMVGYQLDDEPNLYLPAEWLNFKLFGGMEILLNMNRSKKSELFF